MRILTIIFLLMLFWTGGVLAAEPLSSEAIAASLAKDCPYQLGRTSILQGDDMPQRKEVCACMLKQFRAKRQTMWHEKEIIDFYQRSNLACTIPVIRREMGEHCHLRVVPKIARDFDWNQAQSDVFCKCSVADSMAENVHKKRSVEESEQLARARINRCVAEVQASDGQR